MSFAKKTSNLDVIYGTMFGSELLPHQPSLQSLSKTAQLQDFYTVTNFHITETFHQPLLVTHRAKLYIHYQDPRLQALWHFGSIVRTSDP
jgi:hypothetical protein